MTDTFARRLKLAMDAKGWKREELAYKMWDKPGAVSADTIGRYLRGETENPPAQALILLADVLERSTDWLLGKDEAPTHSGVRASKDKVFAGFREFMDESPLAVGISDEEINALASIVWPHHKEPTRALYEKILIDIRSELGTASGLVKKHHAKRGK